MIKISELTDDEVQMICDKVRKCKNCPLSVRGAECYWLLESARLTYLIIIIWRKRKMKKKLFDITATERMQICMQQQRIIPLCPSCKLHKFCDLMIELGEMGFQSINEFIEKYKDFEVEVDD